MSPHARLRESALFKATVDHAREVQPIPPPPPESGFTLEDALKARAAWRQNASPAFRDLTDAPPVNASDAPPTPV